LATPHQARPRIKGAAAPRKLVERPPGQAFVGAFMAGCGGRGASL